MTIDFKTAAGLAAALPLLALAAPAHATRVGDERLPAYTQAASHDNGRRQLGPKDGWRENHGRETAREHADDHAAFKRHDSPCG